MYLEIRVALALVLQYNYTQLLVVLFLVLRSASHLYNVYLHRRPCSLSAFSGFGPRRVTKYQLTFYFGVSCIWAIYNDLGPVHPKWSFVRESPPKWSQIMDPGIASPQICQVADFLPDVENCFESTKGIAVKSLMSQRSKESLFEKRVTKTLLFNCMYIYIYNFMYIYLYGYMLYTVDWDIWFRYAGQT